MFFAILTVFIAIASNGLAVCIDYSTKLDKSAKSKVTTRLSIWLLILSWIVILDYNMMIPYVMSIMVALLYSFVLLIREVYQLVLYDKPNAKQALLVDITCIPVLIITLLTAIYKQYITNSLQTSVDATLLILISFISLIAITLVISINAFKSQTLTKR